MHVNILICIVLYIKNQDEHGKYLKLKKGKKTSNYQNVTLLWYDHHQHMIPVQLAWRSMNQSKQINFQLQANYKGS